MMTVICDPDQAIVRPAVTYGKNVIYALARMAWPASVLPSDQTAPGPVAGVDDGLEGALDPDAIFVGDDQRREELDGVAAVPGDLNRGSCAQ